MQSFHSDRRFSSLSCLVSIKTSRLFNRVYYLLQQMNWAHNDKDLNVLRLSLKTWSSQRCASMLICKFKIVILIAQELIVMMMMLRALLFQECIIEIFCVMTVKSSNFLNSDMNAFNARTFVSVSSVLKHYVIVMTLNMILWNFQASNTQD